MAAELPAAAPLQSEPAATTIAAAQAGAHALGHAQMFAISAMAFALSALWGSLLTVVAPLQVEDILRRSGLRAADVEAQKSGALGLVVAAGAIIALVVPPLVGAWSDRTTARLGRRRPWIIGGVLSALAGLLVMMNPAGLPIYILGYLVVQAGSNMAGAAYNGVIPDLVPDGQRGHASGWLGMMTILGNITGLVLGSFGLARAHADDLLTADQQILVYGGLIGILLAFLLVTHFGVRETPLAGPVARQPFGALLRSLWISPRQYPDFAWVWITRFMVTMGFNTVQFFLVYFLQDVVGIPRDQIAEHSAYMFLGLLLSAAVASILGGRISDRRGRKPLIYLAGALMSLIMILFISYMLAGVVPAPGPFLAVFNTVFYLGIGFGFGYGTYAAVDWALGTDVLPNKDTAAAKDLGVWHIAMVLPQSLATVLAGWLLTATASAGIAAGPRYSLVFGMAIVYFILGTIFVRNVRKAR